jgi:protein involved in polysaccharide export with SLBB domain
VRGAQTGPSLLPVRRSARLREVLAHIPVDEATADLGGVYILRKSVADQQKRALQDTLRRLERAVLTHTSATLEASQIRKEEAEMISKFVERAKQIQPDGLIVVSDGERVRNIALEAGDVIVVPQKSDVVMISGEVRMPASVVYAKGRSVDYYVQQSGGYSDRASKDTLVVRPNGRVEQNPGSDIGPGDQILVMPHVDTKFVPVIKDLAQVFYQIAVSGRMVDLITKQ